MPRPGSGDAMWKALFPVGFEAILCARVAIDPPSVELLTEPCPKGSVS